MQYVNVALFAGLALLCLRIAQRRRTAAARWAAVTFGVIGAVSVLGAVLPDTVDDVVVMKLILLGIVVYPYALYRFAATFEHLSRRSDIAVAVAGAAVAVITIAVPRLPGEDDPSPWWFWPYAVIFLAYWVGVGFLVARRLWRAGRGLPKVTRYRMRTLALGAGGLALALVPGISDVLSVLPAVSAVLFFVGFSPPSWLRALWRRSDESAMRRVELELIKAESREAVLAAVLPHAAALVGGRTATVVAGQIAVAVGDRGDHETALRLPLGGGYLVVEAGPYTPFFGDDELEMLRSLAAFVDLLLERTELLERERKARATAERTSEELETLVYGISHDLKSPVISLLGYLEYMREDHGDAIGADGRHYLTRMETAAVYMQALLADLLELSRVGRIGVDTTDVHLGALVDDVRVDVVSKFPRASIEIGALPVVTMNESRARQLFTNLIENAARHGGRDDVAIRVFGEVRADGSATVSVVDDGVGIPAEYRDKAFGIFERLSPRDSTSGTGIGLALCRKIVETVGGTIEIVDTPVGTHVRITFPAGAVAADRQPSFEVSR